jgi:glycosyltransferase involved in cell wall biosynthesis
MKISVITATHNSAQFLLDCLNSVANQTHRNIEHIAIDGASEDGTLEILQSNLSQLAMLVSEPDAGIYDALNKGIAHASGEVICFLHSDDVFFSQYVLENIASIFEADNSVSAVYGDLVYVRSSRPDRVVRTWRSSSFSPCLLKNGWMPPHTTLYVRREWYESIGGFDKRYRIAADYFSILRLFSQPNFKAVYLPEVLIKMRLGGTSNRSLGAILRKSTEDWDALRRSGFGVFGAARAIVLKNLSKVGQFF